ncbi:hypothetical protein BJ322DRAFT_1207527 [Thelephora terrestris]|uniref:Uncharacterized protein n=1 Tax=Thelephora terrestris TaxID=56493 RepID=A0A9P6HSV6_9AGAM|nr:hypothetical protein BJ322DRAFT_1207527 [Thelephora terrestris]
MATKTLRPKARDAALSKLDVAIECLSVAKEISGITPVQVALGSLGALLTVIRDTMANEQRYEELGLNCADICQALDRGTDERKLGEKQPDEKKTDGKKSDEKRTDKKKEEKRTDEKKKEEKKAEVKKAEVKKADEKKLDSNPSQPVREATNQPAKTVAEPRRKVTKQSARTPAPKPSRISKSEKDEIAAWRAELNRILHVFNTELLDNTSGAASDIRDDVSKIQEETGGQGTQGRSVPRVELGRKLGLSRNPVPYVRV